MRERGDGEEGSRAVAIEVYTKEGCEICGRAKEKLDLMGLEDRNHELSPLIDLHDGGRDDGSVEVRAAYASIDNRLPVIRIDEGFHDYSGAMRRLKTLGKGAIGKKAADGAARPESAVH